MAFSAQTWREADACFSELLEYPESTWSERIQSFNLTREVRECLDRLIAATGDQGPLDQSIAMAPAELSLKPDQLTGQDVGPWRLGREIGRGGMAVVYEARRLGVGFEQIAAVKLLPRGSAGQDQFRREQALLAQLEHPFIAGFLDAGVTEDGTPWIAMERVVGAPLEQVTEGWDDSSIVALMRRVIEAVAFAHRHLIIHRDLKPGNVLVDDSGHPRLLDFGIAKLLSPEALDSGTRVMTPEYAAPEQFSGKSVSTATDVFGLGAILHRLLAGSAPRLRNGEMAPSLDAIADADLRAIVEKALRDDPQHRYATAEALAADLERWQQREPVLARPDSRRYRFRLWFQRHRGAAIAGLLVGVAIVLGSGAVAWQAHQTAEQARMVFAQNSVLRDLLSAPQRTAMGRQVSMADVLDHAIEMIERHMPEPSRQRALLASSLAVTQGSLGRPESALVLWRRARADLEQVAPDDHRALIHADINIARHLAESGQEAVAEASLVTLAESADQLLASDDGLRALIAAHRYGLAAKQGVQPDAEIVQEMLEIGDQVEWQRSDQEASYRCQRLNVLAGLGRFDEAVREAESVLAWGESVWGSQNGHTLCGYELGLAALSRAGRLEEAEQWANQAISVVSDWLGDGDRVVFTLRHAQANIVQELGRNDEAIALHRAQIERLDRVEGLSSEDRLMPYNGISVALLEAGRYAEAEPIQRRFLTEMAEAGRLHTPAGWLAQANFAELLLFSGRAAEALQFIVAGHDGLLGAAGPEHLMTMFARSVRGGVRIALGQQEAAFADLEHMPERLAEILGDDDVNVMNANVWLAQVKQAQGRPAAARPLVQKAYEWHVSHKGPEHPRTVAIAALLNELAQAGQ